LFWNADKFHNTSRTQQHFCCAQMCEGGCVCNIYDDDMDLILKTRIDGDGQMLCEYVFNNNNAGSNTKIMGNGHAHVWRWRRQLVLQAP
jgi:hypothetical protein